MLPVDGPIVGWRRRASGWPELLAIVAGAFSVTLFALLGRCLVVPGQHRLVVGRRWGWKVAS